MKDKQKSIFTWGVVIIFIPVLIEIEVSSEIKTKITKLISCIWSDSNSCIKKNTWSQNMIYNFKLHSNYLTLDYIFEVNFDWYIGQHFLRRKRNMKCNASYWFINFFLMRIVEGDLFQRQWHEMISSKFQC